jgi:XapX domain-containing protein
LEINVPKIIFGLVLGFAIGLLCSVTGIPLPSPPVLTGSLLVIAMTTGYVGMDYLVGHRPKRHESDCGGASGETKGDR